MRIAVLTSSRADFGIYSPLLKKLRDDNYFNLTIIAFGTHLSRLHGYTLAEIEKDNFSTVHQISSMVANDDLNSIVTSYGLTVLKFAAYWDNNKYDLVLCLGDRYEMSAAVQAGIPFGIKFAHLHGGETTLGAIDNIYRHQITLASALHFVSTEQYSKKVVDLIGSSDHIHTVGALSLDEIEDFNPIDKALFFKKLGLPEIDFALVTFHPETVDPENNRLFAVEMHAALSQIASDLFLLITMPNADSLSSIYREKLILLEREFPNKVLCIENLGNQYYFSALYYSKLLIGNSSSGILEAASFQKYVVNIGDRQKGRARSTNVIDCRFSRSEILAAVDFASNHVFSGGNIYYRKNSSDLIIHKIKAYNEAI